MAPLATAKTRCVLLPLIVRPPAGPTMVTSLVMTRAVGPNARLLSFRVRVMVCGVAKAPAVSKTIVLGAGLAILAGLALVLTLAQPTARSVPTSYESAVLVTRYDELASIGADVHGGSGLSPAGPRRAPRWSVAGCLRRRCRRRSPGCRATGPSSGSARRSAERCQQGVERI